MTGVRSLREPDGRVHFRSLPQLPPEGYTRTREQAAQASGTVMGIGPGNACPHRTARRHAKFTENLFRIY